MRSLYPFRNLSRGYLEGHEKLYPPCNEASPDPYTPGGYSSEVLTVGLRSPCEAAERPGSLRTRPCVSLASLPITGYITQRARDLLTRLTHQLPLQSAATNQRRHLPIEVISPLMRNSSCSPRLPSNRIVRKQPDCF